MNMRLVLTHCEHSRSVIITTVFKENYRITYCPEGTCGDMKATSKTILFGKATHERKVHQWPIAVFAKSDDARGYATFLKLAYRAKDDEAITGLDPKCAKDAEGKPLYDTKWSMVTVPYAPLPEMDADDSAVSDETPTA